MDRNREAINLDTCIKHGTAGLVAGLLCSAVFLIVSTFRLDISQVPSQADVVVWGVDADRVALWSFAFPIIFLLMGIAVAKLRPVKHLSSQYSASSIGVKVFLLVFALILSMLSLFAFGLKAAFMLD